MSPDESFEHLVIIDHIVIYSDDGGIGEGVQCGYNLLVGASILAEANLQAALLQLHQGFGQGRIAQTVFQPKDDAVSRHGLPHE